YSASSTTSTPPLSLHDALPISGSEVSVIGAIGVLDDDKARLAEQLASLPAVERVVPVLKRFKLASREFQPDPTVVKVDGLSIGRSEEHTSELQSPDQLGYQLLL